MQVVEAGGAKRGGRSIAAIGSSHRLRFKLPNGYATLMCGKSLTCRTGDSIIFMGLRPKSARSETALNLFKHFPASPRLAAHRSGGAICQVVRLFQPTSVVGKKYYLFQGDKSAALSGIFKTFSHPELSVRILAVNSSRNCVKRSLSWHG